MRFHRWIYRFATWLLFRQGRPACAARDLTVDGAAGPLRARLYGGGSREAVVLFFHGGGFCIGDLQTHDPVCRDIAVGAGVAVLAIDYRLAPEHPYPAAPEDAWAAFEWLLRSGEALGVDSRRVVVCGDSAGGNLSAVVALKARDAGETALIGQVLIYPATADFLKGGVRERAKTTRRVLTPRLLNQFFTAVLPDGKGSDQPDAAPLNAASHGGLAPALITVAERDPLRPDGIAYAEKLRAAGVPVSFIDYPGLDHGYLNTGGRNKAYRAAIADICRWLRELLGTG